MRAAEKKEDDGREYAGQGNLSESEAAAASAADQAAHVAPSTPRKWAGRVILGLQKVVDKMLGGRVVQLQGQVIDQDRELSELVRDVGELTAQLVQLNRKLHAMDERLAQLEQNNRAADAE